MTTSPPPVTLTTYSGQTMACHERIARDEHELRACLAEARVRGWTVSVRGGGMAFDTHALNEGMVIQLRGFDAIGEVTPERTITVGANATWGAILAATKRAGCVPYVMISTERATAGGTLSADCLSRFSPTCGKEGNHVARARVMTLDGVVRECSREVEPELFRGVVSGFGYVAIVLEVTYELLDLGFTDIVVKTEFTEFRGLAGLAEALVSKVAEQHARLGRDEVAPTSLDALKAVSPDDVRAISAVVYMNAARQGFVMHSSYVDGATHPLSPSPFHQPRSFLQRALQVLAFFEPARVLGYAYILDFYLPRHREAVDELEGFTFFQGGNDAVRARGRALGLPMGIRQQTYVIPRSAGDADGTKRRLTSFLERMERVLESRGLLPPLIDVLYLPDDAQERFALSSNRGISGYAVTITFEEPLRASFPDEERAMSDIADVAFELGGRVHLVKNVSAHVEPLERTYSEGRDDLAALRAVHDPERLLSNAFLRRVLPSLARP